MSHFGISYGRNSAVKELTRLEGSFRTQKQHYSLARIKARNRKTGLWNVLGMVATSISFLPILLTEMLVEIPSIVRAGDSVGGMIELLIEWIFITLMVVGIAVFVHAVNMLTISPVRHLIMGLVYCVVTGLILAKQLNVERIIELKTVYGIIS